MTFEQVTVFLIQYKMYIIIMQLSGGVPIAISLQCEYFECKNVSVF